MDTFGDVLRRRMTERGLSQHAMAAAVGLSQSYIAQVLRGDVPLAAKRIDGWADALGLAGRERDRFRLLALLGHCPPEVRAYVERLEGRR